MQRLSSIHSTFNSKVKLPKQYMKGNASANNLYTSSTPFDTSGAFVLECWYRTMNAGTRQAVCTVSFNNAGTSQRLSFLAIRATNYAIFFLDGYEAVSTSTLNNNQWYHLKGVRSGSTITLYINNVAQNSVSINSTLRTNGTKLVIGSENTEGTSQPMAGILYQVRFTTGTNTTPYSANSDMVSTNTGCKALIQVYTNPTTQVKSIREIINNTALTNVNGGLTIGTFTPNVF